MREIPDKPPPPYTPPTETRAPKPPRMFADENIQEKVEKHITDPETASCEPTEAFDVFVKDYCQESLERHKQEQSDKPWDACNLLPQKPQVNLQKLVDKTSTELKEVLTTVTPATVSGEQPICLFYLIFFVNFWFFKTELPLFIPQICCSIRKFEFLTEI